MMWMKGRGEEKKKGGRQETSLSSGGREEEKTEKMLTMKHFFASSPTLFLPSSHFLYFLFVQVLLTVNEIIIITLN